VTEAHYTRAHATWAASATAANWHCPGRIAMSTMAGEEKESIYAATGTAVHQIAEKCLRQNIDAIAFLDADNWYYPDHLRSLTTLAASTQLEAVASARMLHRLDGTPMMKCPTVDGNAYVDTSCMIVFRPAFRHLIAWVLQGQDTAAETDQFLWRLLRDSGARMAFVDRPTVAYRTRHQVHYDQAREPGPINAVLRVDLHGDRYH